MNNKKLLAVALVTALSPFAANESRAQAASAWSLSGNAGLYSDYRFRGFTQTAYKPSFQGGFDVNHDSGFYFGNWNANVESALFNGASLEMDFYAGYGASAGPIDYDLGVLYYYYPSSANGAEIDNTELYGGISMGGLGLKLAYGVSDFFGVPNSEGNYYVQLSYERELGNGWGVSAAVGYQDPDNGLTDTYTDYSLGVTKDLSGWTVGASIIGTSDKALAQTASSSEDGGKTGVVLSLSKSF